MTEAMTLSVPAEVAPRQANTDEQVINLWLRNKVSEHTREAYGRDILRFRAGVKKPLNEVTLADLLDYSDSITLALRSKNRMLASVRSLFTFATRIGYLRFNVAAALEVRKPKKDLAEKILSVREVHRILEKEPNARNHALIRFLYVSTARVSEACALRWRDLQERKDGAQVTLYGKGGETRAVLLSAETWRELTALAVHHKKDYVALRDEHVFVSKTGKPLRRDEVFRIVRRAGQRIGKPNVSPHWLRHAHITHAQENGAPPYLVQHTAGHKSLATTTSYTHVRPDESSSSYLTL